MKKFAVLLSVLVLFAAALACGSDATPAIVSTAVPPKVKTQTVKTQIVPTLAPTTIPTTIPTPTTYKVGDVISIGDLTLTVNSVSFPAGDQYTKPKQGNKFLVIDLTIENKGAVLATISSMLQMILKDDTGQQYDSDFEAEYAAGGKSPNGDIAPGDKLRGQIGFQIPENAIGLVFIFDAEIFGGGGQVRVSIPNQ